MTPVYTPAKALRLIKRKTAQGEYNVSGSLDLRGCDLKGVTLPTTISGWLDLSGCDLKGVTLPTTISGWLYLRGCDLKGVTLPTTISGWLDLRGCKNTHRGQWWQENGEEARRHCIAVCPKDGFALIQTDTDHFFAGCRNNMTRKQALRHWNRDDARAKQFSAAILAATGEAA